MRPALALCLLLTMMTPTTIARDTDAPDVTATSRATTPVPPPPSWLSDLDALYDTDLRAVGLDDRTFNAEHWWSVATPLLDKHHGFRIDEIGRSVEDRPLRHVRWGTGKTSVLLWSQMHGDESTASMALADLFRFLGEHADHPLVKQLHANTTLHIFPIVNPDGAARFQRRNAQGIDLNRDARMLATPEARTLKALFDQVKPTYGFNLHDQRVGYRAGNSDRGTAIALLSPPYNHAADVNDVRTRAIEVAGVIRTALEPYLAGHIARWDEEFDPRAFGDLTTQWGASTVLIEAGGIEGDVQKQRLRKLYFLGLVAALDSIATGKHAGVSPALYRDLPENGDVWPDLALRGGTLSVPGHPPTRADLLVNFRNPLTETGGAIADVGDLGTKKARRTIDARGLFIVPIAGHAGERTVIEANDDNDEDAGSPMPLTPGASARFVLSRDPQGRDVVWTLDGDVDPATPSPPVR
ncbi:M14 family zinc carboxypeptidase [Pseudoxanthomonas sp. PXM01]|uniref:M14 family zinc carboxypeptidase n=1 Tax=Pseudoxanthomonas sp. PXM01 TaxID=2769295 RepID=UPI00177FB152|nr:M14 family zinc carboxypeptidase [Pseudoxanthomonas sp. PXM01]MBD9469710.1 peptidase M14 [Pseudoxanthomonas sp. PXM01]